MDHCIGKDPRFDDLTRVTTIVVTPKEVQRVLGQKNFDVTDPLHPMGDRKIED